MLTQVTVKTYRGSFFETQFTLSVSKTWNTTKLML